ncbi:hypothetical protein SAMN04489724_2029 [Algoriphagus locisalis]|uniref:Uncharacterized protein n=1 Tax=Algoriphagus locisalis TaxID=305507 RepID=A0A1I7AK00_9BACT|nr:hypothetical protein [Algoriphagus locisalis]SFT75309.1 hypothetical protein SAMN04489724_2029 [Algoriphagus locisalis]
MKTIKLMALVCLAYFAFGCEFDQTEIILNDDLTQALEDDNKGVLRIGENTYIFNDNSKGTITKYKRNSRKHEFLYDTESLNINLENLQENYRLKDDSFIIENEVTDEYLKLLNVDESKPGTISFDVELSNGLKFENLNFTIPPSDSMGSANSRTSVACPWCWPLAYFLAAILDELGDDVYSICALALNNCANAGGVAELEVTEGGWFSESTCTVNCQLPD